MFPRASGRDLGGEGQEEEEGLQERKRREREGRIHVDRRPAAASGSPRPPNVARTPRERERWDRAWRPHPTLEQLP